jgi:Holliday junction resolvase RusA-like endonuclease
MSPNDVLRLSELKDYSLRKRPRVAPPTTPPDDYLVGFVPILPANREAHTIHVDGHGDYTPEYKANYYTLRDAIERDQFDRRGGYRTPYDMPVELFIYVIYRPGSRPLHTDKRTLFDVDNVAKTFQDALTKTSRPTAHGQLKRIRHITDDSRIKTVHVDKDLAEGNELEGVWYSLVPVDESTPEERYALLRTLVNEAMKHQQERREFDLLNLHIAMMDGHAFLNGTECVACNFLDPTYCAGPSSASHTPGKSPSEMHHEAIAPEAPKPEAKNRVARPNKPKRRRCRRRYEIDEEFLNPPGERPRMLNGMPVL